MTNFVKLRTVCTLNSDKNVLITIINRSIIVPVTVT